MPFVRLFPCEIVKRQSGGATFYKREAELSAGAGLLGWRRRRQKSRERPAHNSQTSFVGATDLPNDREP